MFEVKRILRFTHWLQSGTDGRVLGLFRIIFGAFMTYYAVYYHNVRYIKDGLLAPLTLFKYDGFEWVGLLPEPVLQGLLLGMGMGGLCILLGLWMRFATICYVLILSYFTLLEKAYYNNHIYLFILLLFLLTFTHADRFLSVKGNRGFGRMVPRWQLFILQAQVAIVYFYGGLAKLAPDWLSRQEPMRTMVKDYMHTDSEALVHFLNYGGLLIDLAAPLILFYRPIRIWGMIPLALFHITNTQLFNDIGIFPYVMLTSLVLYFDSEELPWWRKRVQKGDPEKSGHLKRTKKSASPVAEASDAAEVLRGRATPLVAGVLMAYFVFQLLFPFRGFFLPNPLDYTTIGNRFSWRMKIDTRDPTEVAVFVKRTDNGEEKQVKIENYLNPMQIRLLYIDPRAVMAFAHKLKQVGREKGNTELEVRAKIKLKYNGRPEQYFVAPDRELTTVQYSAFQKLDWLVPLGQ